jgi:hypothetical protein
MCCSLFFSKSAEISIVGLQVSRRVLFYVRCYLTYLSGIRKDLLRERDWIWPGVHSFCLHTPPRLVLTRPRDISGARMSSLPSPSTSAKSAEATSHSKSGMLRDSQSSGPCGSDTAMGWMRLCAFSFGPAAVPC